MQKNTNSRTATTFNLPDAMHESWSAEDVASLMAPYVWPTVEGAEAAIDRMININGFAYVQYEAPGMSVFAVTDSAGRVQTVIVIEDDTAARLHKAVRREQPVTVTYVKADGDETVRTIEPTSLSLTKAGDVIVKAMDRKSGEKRSFRLDRVRTYTVHRTAFTVRTGTPAPRKVDLVQAFQETVTYTWDVYDTTPGTAAALEAPDAVQSKLSEAYARGEQYAFVTVDPVPEAGLARAARMLIATDPESPAGLDAERELDRVLGRR